MKCTKCLKNELSNENKINKNMICNECYKKQEIVKCQHCKKPVINGKFYTIERAYYKNADEKTQEINCDDLDSSETKNIKYQEIICQNCIQSGKWKNISFR